MELRATIHNFDAKTRSIRISTYFIALTIESPIWTQSTAWSGLSRGAPLIQ